MHQKHQSTPEVCVFEETIECGVLLSPCFSPFSSFPPNPCLTSHLGNVNSHFTFSPSAGSNVTSLLLATRFDYASGLDKIWDYKLLVHITDGNLLSGRRKAKARVETGTVTLSISIIPDPTTIATTTSRVRALEPGLPTYIPCDLHRWSPGTQKKYGRGQKELRC